ncbi:hypothetical protein THIOSC13_80060 [uncultured Thiomicrorhabdus sp.]
MHISFVIALDSSFAFKHIAKFY